MSAATAAKTLFSEPEIKQFRESGFVVVRGLVTGARLADLIGLVDELEALPEEPGKTMAYYEDSVSEPDRRVLSRIEYFDAFHAGLSRFMHGPEMLGRAGELFGEPAVLYKEKVNFKMPGGQGFEPHQDAQAGWQDYGSLHLTVMVSIDPATEENGCLELAPDHNRRGLIGKLWEPLTAQQLEGVEFQKVPTAPGDAIFFDSFAPHRSAANLSDERRRILYITYGRASEGDHREDYFAAKRKNFPPDIEREPGKTYAYKV